VEQESEVSDTEQEPHLLVERDGHIVTVTMNRPKVRNAMGFEMLARLADAWDLVDNDPEVRVVILTGAGGAFSSGADLKTMHSDHPDPWRHRFRDENGKDNGLHWKAFLRSHRIHKPLIAAVEGPAYGGGTEILQATDIRVAGRSAKFAVSEVKWGLFPLGGSTVRLRRQIPHTKAMEMLLTGRAVPADEAERIGLITRVVEDGQALVEARRIAERIASNGPLAVQAIRMSAWESDGLPEAEALANELKHGWPVFMSEDAKEGPRAFAAGRKPEFTGR
jgi:enoyl-CoA hydratase